MNNVEKIKNSGLCISCGVCSANCPFDCIYLELKNGIYQPQVGTNCINCGKCLQVCPSEKIGENIDGSDLTAYITGNYQHILKAKIYDKDALKKSASGGVVTGLISELLTRGDYDVAFVVVGYNYHRKIKTVKIEKAEDLNESRGSRYLPVLHTDAVKYILENKDKRVIIVATSCATLAIEKSIKLNNLKRDNYLLIGLFCDKTMHYGVVDHFDQISETHGHRITELHFRSKERCKWPGNVKLVLDNRKTVFLPSSTRKKLKDYYVPERCLYCVDKLNRSADISVGDNYIKNNADDEGISSVIIRTGMGTEVWNNCSSIFEWSKDEKSELLDSQLINEKKENYAFGGLKGIYPKTDISKDIQKKYSELMRKRKLGISLNSFYKVSRDIRKRQVIDKIKAKLKKILR